MLALPAVQEAVRTFKAVKKGDKGDPGGKGDSIKGDRGLPGINGKNVTEQEVLAVIQRVMRQPKDGVAPTPDEVAASLLSSKKFLGFLKSILKQDSNGPLPTDTIESMITEALSKQKINIADIVGLDARIAEIRNHSATGGKWRGGGDTVVAGPGIKITNTVNGNKEIQTVNTGSTLAFETPTGVVDDTNVTFTVLHEPLYITVNGSQYIVGTGAYASYLAGVITLAYAVGTGGFIISAYNS